MGNNHPVNGLRRKKSDLGINANLDMEKKYDVPSKFEDLERMKDQQFLYNHVFGSSFSAPIKNTLSMGGHVLDVGCGPGTWCCLMATDYPLATFVGIDLVRVFPEQIKPRNVTFFQANFLEKLPFGQTFDFVRLSILNACLLESDWPLLIDEAVRVMKPGGYLEIVEHDSLPIEMGPLYQQFVINYLGLLLKREVNPRIVRSMEKLLAANPSLTNIKRDVRTATIGKRGGPAGELFAQNISTFFQVVIESDLAEFMDVSASEYAHRWEKCAEELKDTTAKMNIYRFWARKL